MAEAAQTTVDQVTAARIIRLSSARVSQLVKDGWIKRQPDGRFLVIDVIHGYLDFRDDSDRRATKSASATRWQEEKTASAQLDRLEREGKLIDIEELSIFVEIIGMLKAEFIGFPARMTREMDLRKKLDGGIADIFNRAAVRNKQAIADLRAGRSVASVADADNAGSVGERE